MCTAGGECGFLPSLLGGAGGTVLKRLVSIDESSGRKFAGAVLGLKKSYASTSRCVRDRLNSVTCTFAFSVSSVGSCPSATSLAFFFASAFVGSTMLLSIPNMTFFLSPASISASRSALSVGLNMQKTTELLAFFTACTTVSIDARWLDDSGEKKTRTLALPTFTGFDQPASLPSDASVGSPASACWRRS